MEFCPQPPTFAADPRVVGSAVRLAPVEHQHIHQGGYVFGMFLFVCICNLSKTNESVFMNLSVGGA